MKQIEKLIREIFKNEDIKNENELYDYIYSDNIYSDIEIQNILRGHVLDCMNLVKNCIPTEEYLDINCERSLFNELLFVYYRT